MSSRIRSRRREVVRILNARRAVALAALGAGLMVGMSPARAANTWDGGGGSDNWGDALNWDNDLVPTFPAPLTFTGFGRLTPNNNLGSVTVNSISFDALAGSFNLGGNAITLSGGTSTLGNANGIYTISGNNQTVSMGITLGAGQHYITTEAGAAGLTINGTITQAAVPLGQNAGTITFYTNSGTVFGGVSSINTTNANPSLQNGASGIIGGHATISTTSTTGSWAMNDGAGNIVPFVPAAADTYGTAGNGGNGLTATSGTTLNSNISFVGGQNLTIPAAAQINTLLMAIPNNVVTFTVTNSGVTTFANGGGIYRNVQVAADPIITGGTITAGTSGPATMYIKTLNTAPPAAGGVSPPEGLQINSVIADNTAVTGPVTLVKSGYGVLRLNATNTFTGGLYVNEGQLRLQTGPSSGASPIFIADGGLLFQGAAITVTNNIFMAGLGPIESGFQDGALRFNSAGAGAIFSGTITLTGNSGATARGGQANSGATGGTISGKITGNFNFSLNFHTGQGTSGLTASMPSITLSNTANDWGGSLTVGRGRVRLGASEVIPDTSDLIIFGESGSQSIVSLDTHTETVNGLQSGAGDTVGSEYITNTVAGQGILRVGANNGNGSYAGAIVDSSAGTAVPGGVAVAGTIQLVKLGTGTQILAGANVFSGGLLVQKGTLRVGSNTALPPTGTVTLGNSTDSGTLDLAGFSPTVGGLAVSGSGSANVIGNSAASPAVLNYATGNTTFAGKIQNTLPGGSSTSGIAVTSGTLTLSGANTFTGGAAVNGGTLSITGSLAAANTTTVNTGGTLAGTGNAGGVMVSGGTLRAGTVAGDLATLTVASLSIPTGTLTVDLGPSSSSDLIHDLGALAIGDGASPLSLTIANATAPAVGNYLIMDYSAGSLTKLSDFTITGPGGVVYALNYATAGKVFLNVSVPLVTYTWSGAADLTSWDTAHANFNNGSTNVVWADNNPAVFNDTAPATATNISITSTVTPLNVTINSTTRNYTFSGADIAGATGLNKSGGSTLTITNDNTYTGGTIINAGTIQVGNGGSTGSLGPGAITNNGTLIFNRADVVNLTNTVSGSGTLQQSGTGTLVLAATNSYGATVVASGGTLQVGDTTTNGTLGTGAVTNNGTLIFNRADLPATPLAVANNISGAGAIQIAGTGAATFSGSINIGAGGLSQINTATTTFTGNLSGAGSLTVGAGTVTLSGTNTYGNTIISGGATLRVGNGGTTGTLGSGSLTNDGTLAFNRSDALAINAPLAGAGNYQQVGSGTTTFNAANTYTGLTVISGGTLAIGAANALSTTASVVFGNIPVVSPPTNYNGYAFTGALDLSTNSATIANLTVNSNSANNNTITLGAGKTLTVAGSVLVGGLTATGTADNPISNLVISGASGTLALSGEGNTLIVSNSKNNNSGGTDSINARLDLSGLGTFTLNYGATGVVGIAAGVLGTGSGTSSNAPFGTLTLAASNTITAGTLNVGLNNGGGNTGKGVLLLGTANVINVDNIAVGAGKTQPTTFDPNNPNPGGALRFNTGLTNPTLTLRGAAAGAAVMPDPNARVANFTIVNGDLYTGGSGTNESGIVDFSAGSVNARIDTLQVAVGSNNGNTGAATFGILSFGAGTLDVSTAQLGIEDRIGTATNASVTGTLNVLGPGSVIIGAGGLELGHRPTAASAITGTINITGGTVTLSGGDIFGGGGTGNVNLNGGTLDLAGHNLGTATGAVTNLNLQAGTLRNVAEINGGVAGGVTGGGDLNKSGAGTLTVNGTSTFTGNINNNGVGGVLNLAGAQTHPNTASLNASAGTTNIQSDPGSINAYTLAVNVTPASGNAIVHVATSSTDSVHVRDLRVNDVGMAGAGLVIIDAAATGSAPNPRTNFGAVGGSVALYIGDSAGNAGFATRATIENLWKSAALEGYWALQNHLVTAITRGLTLDPSVVSDATKNGLVVIPSVDNANHAVTYAGEDIQGDTNGDGKVDINDLGTVLQHLNTTPGSQAGESGFTLYTPGEGDVNGDLVVNINDLGTVLGHLNQSYAPSASGGGVSAVPEPASALLLALGGAALLRRRRRASR